MISPFEVLVTLFSPGRRIGDFVAKTRVVPLDPGGERPGVNWLQVFISLLRAYAFLLVLMSPYFWMTREIEKDRTVFVKSSLNPGASQELRQFFERQLADRVDVDIAVYDSIAGRDMKFVSGIFRLKSKVDDDQFEQLKEETKKLMLTKYPEKTFVGRLQYSYQANGSWKYSESMLDWRDE